MTYTSPIFLCAFLPFIILLYNIMSQKHRWKVLLGASYIFFWIISNKLIIYLLITTAIIYISGKKIDLIQGERNDILKTAQKEDKKEIKNRYNKKQKKIIVIANLVLLGILVVLKYTAFLGTNFNNLFELLKIPITLKIPSFVLPIGISFYTLQAVSYLMDVYKEKIKADKNLGRLALFISFFPQIMEGPICRYDEIAESLWKCERTNYTRLCFGVQRILFGFMKKVLIVDRINPIILEIFDNYSNYDGGIIAVGMVLYTVQLYMDFSGVMDIVIGIAEIFGVKMPENFRQPFFSKTISEFWTRWHITLGAWFRDYIYYPVSLTEKCKNITSKARKKIGNYYGPLLASTVALFCVWILNGLWHGSDWNYVFFGMYHFTIILIGRVIEPLVKKFNAKAHINNQWIAYKFFQTIRTTILVFIGELFFRANGLNAGLTMFGIMCSKFSLSSFKNGKIWELGVDKADMGLIFFVLIVIFIISVLKEKQIDIRKSIASKNIVIRWTLYYLLLIAIVLFGTYGLGVVHLDPIYANF